MSNLSEESIDRTEKQCMEDYREHEGRILLATCIHGYVGDDYHEFNLERPAQVLVIKNQKENTIINWTTHEWCDTYWDVELLEPHEELRMARSLWVDGISRNIRGGFNAPSEWKIDANQKRDEAILNPENPDTPELAEKKIIEHYQQRAREFFKNELDENDWNIDDKPAVSLSGEGAYIQLWRWFPAEEEDES